MINSVVSTGAFRRGSLRDGAQRRTRDPDTTGSCCSGFRVRSFSLAPRNDLVVRIAALHRESFRTARSAGPGIQTDAWSSMYYVYLLASRKQGTLYLGVTGALIGEVTKHKSKATPGFASRYDVRRLVWYESYDDPTSAITREKEIKKWRRDWKVALIEKENPDWRDLYSEITK